MNQLWLGLTGREFIRSRRPSVQSDAVPGGVMFWVFVLSCMAGAGIQVVLCFSLPWPWDLAGGLVVLFAAIPAASIGANRLVKRLRRAKAVKLWQVAAARRTARNLSNPAIKEHVESEAFTLKHGLGKKMAILIPFTIFWYGITSAFTFFVVVSLVKHQYAALRFASAEGVLSASVNESNGDM